MSSGNISLNYAPVEPQVAIAGADLTGKEGYHVKFSSGKLVLCSAAGEAAAGVLVAGAAANEYVTYSILNPVKVVAGAQLAAGTQCMTSAAGKAVAHAGAGTLRSGILLESASGDGAIVWFQPLPGKEIGT